VFRRLDEFRRWVDWVFNFVVEVGREFKSEYDFSSQDFLSHLKALLLISIRIKVLLALQKLLDCRC
jgi:hypothetical protein